MPEPGTDNVEAQLADLAGRLSWPATPDLAGTATARLAAVPVKPHHPPTRVLLLAAGVAVVVAAVVGAWPGTRRAVGDLLGLRGVRISTGPPLAVPTTARPARLDLGEPATLAAASQRIGFTVRIPTSSGFDHPDAVFVSTPPPEGEATLMYLPRPGLPAAAQTRVGLLLSEFKGTMEAGIFAKVAEPGTTIEALSVHGQPGYWLSGAPHAFFYRSVSGEVYLDTLRLAGNTLVWQAGSVTLRVEGDVSRAEALAIANSLP